MIIIDEIERDKNLRYFMIQSKINNLMSQNEGGGKVDHIMHIYTKNKANNKYDDESLIKIFREEMKQMKNIWFDKMINETRPTASADDITCIGGVNNQAKTIEEGEGSWEDKKEKFNNIYKIVEEALIPYYTEVMNREIRGESAHSSESNSNTIRRSTYASEVSMDEYVHIQGVPDYIVKQIDRDIYRSSLKWSIELEAIEEEGEDDDGDGNAQQQQREEEEKKKKQIIIMSDDKVKNETVKKSNRSNKLEMIEEKYNKLRALLLCYACKFEWNAIVFLICFYYIFY